MAGSMLSCNAARALAVLLVLVSQLSIASCETTRRAEKSRWVDIWGSMPQLVEYTNMPPVPFNGTGVVFQNATLRQTIFITQSAETIRLVVSNAFGAAELPITSATLAVPLNGSAGTSAVDPASLAPVTWSGGQPSVVIPNGARAVSDPIAYPVAAQAVLTVSMYLAAGQPTNLITGHPGSRTNSYYTPGNATAAADAADDPATQTSQHWYFLSGVEAYLPASLGTRALAIVGDSITDGRGSDNNLNDRWPDNLLRRLQGSGPLANSSSSTSPTSPSTTNTNTTTTAVQRAVAVINQAAGGNRVLADGNGPNALGRVDRDVLAHSGTAYAMIFEGVNDIGTAAADPAAQRDVGDRLLAAYDQMVALCHARGLPVFGATITPFGGEGQAYSDPERERTRQRVNAWIRGGGGGGSGDSDSSNSSSSASGSRSRFDAVVDFDAVMRDPANATMLNPLYDSGDHLHPNPLGYRVMADAFDLGLFDQFKDGVDEMV